VTIGCEMGPDVQPPCTYERAFSARKAEVSAWRNATCDVTSSSESVNRWVARSGSDLQMMTTHTPYGLYPYAGVPWFSTPFGRDGIITAMELLWAQPDLARGVLAFLSATQATRVSDAQDAQPGKILHEMRGGEMAALGEIPFGLYYGSVDATPLFVLLAGLYAERTGDDETVAALWPNIEAALAWIDGPGDADGDGFVEYYRATEQGLANQGWKDSYDAIFHADGLLAEGPIALAEVQGYVYGAKHTAARCAERLGHGKQARHLKAQADELAQRFDASFWCPELGTYAMALDGKKQRCRVRSSNAGQVLFTGIAKPERAAEVADLLLRPQFFTGWGIRTIANTEARYNPMSYHNGSVWPHDNALIALGLARYGRQRAVERLFKGLFEAATYMDMRRLPELFCGFQRGRGRGPTLYPVACSPQAWASATPFTLLEASLGLEFDPIANEIRLRNPRLPEFLDEVVLRNLRLKQASVDLKVNRHDTEVSVEILRRRGQVQVSVVFP
jgi:glycogen debranching enzyme